jgi:hypothetical protein
MSKKFLFFASLTFCKTDLTEYMERIYSSEEKEGKFKIDKNEELSYKKEQDNIKIT